MSRLRMFYMFSITKEESDLSITKEESDLVALEANYTLSAQPNSQVRMEFQR